MTRDRDQFIELEDRARFANGQEADLFVSIHVNSHPQRSVKGIEIYHFGEAKDQRALEVAARENGTPLNSTGVGWEYLVADLLTAKKIEASLELAWTAKEAMVANLNDHYALVDHGVKTAPFYVLRFTSMPSILAEIAYISNSSEEDLLRTTSSPRAWRKHYEEGINTFLASSKPPGDDVRTVLSPTPMPTVKLVLEYDGTCYAGWQRQPDHPTIQEAIERAIRQVSQATVSVIGAGRTDSGVHALGQVASFRTDRGWPASELDAGTQCRAAKRHCRSFLRPMDDHFHAQHDAQGKLYTYRILHRPARPTVDRAFMWHIYRPLDEAAMQQSAVTLIGSQDFSSFEGSLTDNTNPICHLQRLAVIRHDDHITLRPMLIGF